MNNLEDENSNDESDGAEESQSDLEPKSDNYASNVSKTCCFQ